MFTRRLVLPFFVVGLTHTVFIAQLTGFNFFVYDRAHTAPGWMFLSATPFLCAALGAVVAPGNRVSWHRFLQLVPAAGAVNGSIALMTVFVVENNVSALRMTMAAFIGAIGGAVISAAYLPTLGIVAQATRVMSIARTGSILDRANHRAIWGAALKVVGATGFLATILRDQAGVHFGAFATLDVTAASAIGFAVLFLLDLGAYRRVQAYAARPTRPRGASAIAGESIDYGVGDEIHEEIAPPVMAYREVETIVRVYLGDPAQTRSFLVRSIAMNAAAFVAATVATIFGIRGIG